MKFAPLLRFALVGVANTAMYYGCYLVIKLVAVYIVAHVLATLIAMVWSYFLNCYFTFKIRPSMKSFLLFPASNLVNMAVTTATLPLLVGVAGVSEEIAPLLVGLAAVPVTYLVARLVMVGRVGLPGRGAVET